MVWYCSKDLDHHFEGSQLHETATTFMMINYVRRSGKCIVSLSYSSCAHGQLLNFDCMLESKKGNLENLENGKKKGPE